MDKISKESRSLNMAKIKSKNTSPELLLRKALFAEKLRYRIHYNLPGSPDVVFPSKKLAIFINGCFWHGHKCKNDHKPKSNEEFWDIKIKNNIKRDKKNYKKIKELGWNYYIVWECDIIENLERIKKSIKKLLL